MSNNVLGPVVESFVTEVTSALDEATAHLSDVDRTHFQSDVTTEAFNLVVAVIDADARHTDEELTALIVTFGPVLPVPDLATSSSELLRDSSTITGGAAWLDSDSELFSLLVEADLRNADSGSPSRYSQTYYERALDLAHVVASLDVLPSTGTLEAISRLRNRLLHRITGVIPPVGPTGQGPFVGDRTTWTGPNGTPGSQAGGIAQRSAQTDDDASNSGALPPPRPLEDLLAELDELVGLDEVKSRVHLVADFLFVQNLRRERDLPVIETSYHLVFTGNPGTGKTTVARLLAQIYRTLGVVSRGHLVETDRSELVAGYVGQTAPLVTAKFDEAEEGILFIDEAYSLTRGGENDFGREAIDQIVKLMEDRRDRVVLIVAGYPVEMEQFISTNPGLRSRFPTTIEFPDYSNEDLLRIVESIGAKSAYKLTPEAREKFIRELESIPRDKGFGNARLARNMFESAINRQASRIVKLENPDDELLTTLEAEDIAAPDAPAGRVHEEDLTP